MSKMRSAYPQCKAVYVDVDGTLCESVAEWARGKKAEGYTAVLWSSAGADHARAEADRIGCADVWDHILTKPGIIVDDRGTTWAGYASVIHPRQIIGAALKRSRMTQEGR